MSTVSAHPIGLSSRSMWLGWLITLVFPVMGFNLFLPAFINREELLLRHSIQKQLVNEMRSLQRQLFLFDFSSRKKEDVLARLNSALASESVNNPGLTRRLVENEERETLPGFASTTNGMVYRDFLPAESYHLVVNDPPEVQTLQKIMAKAPIMRLETGVPFHRLTHPSRVLMPWISAALFTLLLLSAIGIAMRRRIFQTIASLRIKIGLILALGLVVPVTGFWFATLSRLEMQSLLQKTELATHLEQQLESLEYRLANLEDQKALELLALADSLTDRLINPDTARDALKSLVNSWPVGVLCMIWPDKTWAEAKPESPQYRLPEHQGLRSGVRQMTIAAVRPTLFQPMEEKPTVEHHPPPEEVLVESLLHSVLSLDRLAMIHRNPGVIFQGFETMSFTRTMILPLASWSAALEMTGKGELFWIPFLNRLVKGIPGESLSGLKEKTSFASIECGIFLKPYRHALSFENSWLPETTDSQEILSQAAHQNLFEGNACLTDAWNQKIPFLMYVRPFANLPFVGVARAIPMGRNRFIQQLSGAFTGMYSLGLLLFLSWALARLISGPISLFVLAVEKVRAGNYRTRVRIKSGDEIEEIGETFNQMVLGLDQKRRFSRFVSENVIESVKDDDLKAASCREEVTVLFSHIRDFSSMMAERSPKEVFNFLNLYFTQMGFVIRKQKGTIDKFIGDAIMAVFQDRGDAKISEAAPVRATRAALLMKEQVANLNAFRRQRGQATVEIGIGLHRGEVISGRIGSQHGRLDFTVIGDTVNLAARLESKSHLAVTSGILLSRAVAEVLPEDIPKTALGQISVKGRSETVSIFEPTAKKTCIAK